MMNNLQAIIFDLDNTLLHFEDYWKVAVKETFLAFHLTASMNPDPLFKVYQEQDDIFCELFDAGKITLNELREQLLFETLKVFDIVATDQDFISFQNLYTATASRFMRPNREYNELLRRLSEKYKLAIMTNGSSDFQREKLKRTELDKYIHKDYIFISEEMGYSKPSPHIYQGALTRMHMNAADVLFIGDSIGNDILGPMNTGMKTVWVNRDGKTPPEQVVSFPVIKDVLELVDML